MKTDRKTRLALQLLSVPKLIRERMLAEPRSLRPGAGAAVGRFFTELTTRREPIDAPSRATFDAAARSEPTLHTLLVTLERFAPEVCLAAGREARKAWYRKRPKPVLVDIAPVSRDRASFWPAKWVMHLPALQASGKQCSARSVAMYLYGLDRCAQALRRIGAEPIIDRWTAYKLLEQFRREGLRWATCGNYLAGLDALARAAEVDKHDRDGVFEIVLHARALARREGKLKTRRLAELHEAGGYALLADVVGQQRAAARDGRAWTAAAERHLQTTAILAIIINSAPRSGDLAAWRLGLELERHAVCGWSLHWTQGKTEHDVAFGPLWPEVSEILDELLCRGRPRRLARVRYASLRGRNWLTHDETGKRGRWATELVKRVVGNPIHDIRTLAFDYLRMHDPAVATQIGAVFLGHRDQRTGEAYRSRDEGVASSRSWRADREALRRMGGMAPPPQERTGIRYS